MHPIHNAKLNFESPLKVLKFQYSLHVQNPESFSETWGKLFMNSKQGLFSNIEMGQGKHSQSKREEWVDSKKQTKGDLNAAGHTLNPNASLEIMVQSSALQLGS